MLQFASLLQAPQVGRSQDPPGTPRMCGNQTVGVEMGGASVWPMEKVQQLAKTRCGISSSSSLLHHALDLAHATGHALVLPSSFCLPCPSVGKRFADYSSYIGVGGDESIDLDLKAAEAPMQDSVEAGVGGGESRNWLDGVSSGVVLTGQSIGWLGQAAALLMSLCRLVARLPPHMSTQKHAQHSTHTAHTSLTAHEGVSAQGDSANLHTCVWSVLISALRPVLGLNVRCGKVAVKASRWGGKVGVEDFDVSAQEIVEELNRFDPHAMSLRRGMLLPGVAKVLLTRAGWPSWHVTAEILARQGLLVLPARAGVAAVALGDADAAGKWVGVEWLGAAHVTLLGNQYACPTFAVGMPPFGGYAKIVQVAGVEGRCCWREGGGQRIGAVGGGAGHGVGAICEGGETLLRVVMRRLLGVLSLARTTTSHTTTSSCGSAACGSGAASCSSVAAGQRSAEAHVWRDVGNTGGRTSGSRGCVVSDNRGGGVLPLPNGLWVRVEILTCSPQVAPAVSPSLSSRSSPLSSSSSATSTYSQTSTSSPCSVGELPSLHITVAREEGVDAEEVLVVSKEVQRVAEGIVASLLLGAHSMEWQWRGVGSMT